MFTHKYKNFIPAYSSAKL